MRVDFYHLTRTPVAPVLPMIAEKLWAGGERLLICVGDDIGLADRIDASLWTYRPESFLPHAKAGGVRDADQPVLIASVVVPINAARNVVLADGIWRDDALGFARAFHFFTDDGIEDARGAWRALGDRDAINRHYWKQDQGGKWREGP